MRFTRIRLKNWRNFRSADVELQERMFLVGPNASGKSNFLDALRFLRDVADAEGGLRRAVSERKGVSRIRSLTASPSSSVAIEVEVLLGEKPTSWSYWLEFSSSGSGLRPVVRKEVVRRGDKVVLERPDEQDREDKRRLTQTYLEQASANKPFRELADFLSEVRYLHIVPQLVREPERLAARERDPYGSDFIERIATTPTERLDKRLQRMKRVLKAAVPRLEDLRLERDESGVAHLEGLLKLSGPRSDWHSEEQLSDGTLRLLGLLWALLDGKAPLLLEEPELSLHVAVVRQLPQLMVRLLRKRRRQVLVSTHSADLLADEGIDLGEVLLLEPSEKGTQVRKAREFEQLQALVEGGVPVGEAVMPHAAPPEAQQMLLLED